MLFAINFITILHLETDDSLFFTSAHRRLRTGIEKEKDEEEEEKAEEEDVEEEEEDVEEEEGVEEQEEHPDRLASRPCGLAFAHAWGLKDHQIRGCPVDEPPAKRYKREDDGV